VILAAIAADTYPKRARVADASWTQRRTIRVARPRAQHRSGRV